MNSNKCFSTLRSTRGLLVLGLALLLPQASVSGAPDFPKPQGRVNDFAGVLDAPSKAQLQAIIAQVEAQTSDEFAVVTVKSLDGLSVEEYANGLFHQWGIGKKGKDNGLLVLICPQERKIRIEVGFGLEEKVTDGTCGTIIRHYFTPAFKQGDYGKGAVEGLQKLSELVMGTASAPETDLDDSAFPSVPQEEDGFSRYGVGLFIIPFVFLGLMGFGYSLTAKVLSLSLWGFFFSGIPLLMAFLFGPEKWVLWLDGGLGAAAFLGGLWLGVRYPKGFHTGKGGKGGSSWDPNNTFDSGGGFSSSSSDDFGGGDSGGGGASGSW